MKRIKAACICQTLHFSLREEMPREMAAPLVQREVEQYLQGLERNRTQYRIVERADLPDGSVELKVIKQYNLSPVGDYLK